jgi:hypothetical protein
LEFAQFHPVLDPLSLSHARERKRERGREREIEQF